MKKKETLTSWIDGSPFDVYKCNQYFDDATKNKLQVIFYNKGNSIFGSYISSDFPEKISKKAVEKLLTKFKKFEELGGVK